MDISALQLESRFSFSPNSLGYCGKDSAATAFIHCLNNNKCSSIQKEVKHFIVLYPYLRTIARYAQLPVFSYKVIESYWLGNDLLKKAKKKDYEILLNYFAKQGVPDFFIAELKSKGPKVFIPSHLFQVLHVGVGKASGAVPFNIKSINNCMIRWGKVSKLSTDRAEINLNSLKLVRNKYKLLVIREGVPHDSRFTPQLKIGDIVAIHWNLIVKILSEKETENLEYWTREVIAKI